jgi:hypothetical protein
MTFDQHKKLTVPEILDAANKHYDEGYLSAYYHKISGEPKMGSGDTLAKFIVCELRESFNPEDSRAQQIASAIRVLDRAKRDIQGAIEGLHEL